MFGSTKKTNKLIDAEKLEKMTAILATVGLDDPDHYGFQSHVQNPENYFGGGFEWSERGKNMRFYFHAFEGQPIRSVSVYVLSGGKNFLYSKEVIAEANRQLDELFS